MSITDGQLLIGTTSGDSLKLATLTAGAGITITNGAGAITIASGAQDTVVTSTSTGTQNDFAPGLSGNTLLRMNNASDTTITGFSGGTDGQRLTIVSIGAGNVFLAPQNTGSSASNRLINSITLGSTPLAAGSGRAVFEYDATTARWRLISHEQGAPIDVPYSAGNFTASGSMTWTVDSGDVNINRYLVVGRVLHWLFRFFATSVGGTASNELLVTIPNSFQTVSFGFGAVGGNFRLNDAGATAVVGQVWLELTSLTQINFRKVDDSNYSLSTNTTHVFGNLAFEID